MSDVPLTPLVHAPWLSSPGRRAWLKDETVLPTGSFKVRGAMHALRRKLHAGPIAEVVAASTGNHGAAVAWAAQRAGVRARIFVPVDANPIKLAHVRDAGAEVVASGADLTDAIDTAERYATEAGAYFLHDAFDPDVPAGTAAIGVELLIQLPEVAAVYVPMGDTALIRGVATALRSEARRVRVIGVVAANAPSYFLSWKAGQVIETASAATSADGLAVRRPLAQNVQAVRALVDDVVTVTEDEMFGAIVDLHRAMGWVIEPSAAASVAALRRDLTATGDLAAIVTGRNIAPDLRRDLLGA